MVIPQERFSLGVREDRLPQRHATGIVVFQVGITGLPVRRGPFVWFWPSITRNVNFESERTSGFPGRGVKLPAAKDHVLWIAERALPT